MMSPEQINILSDYKFFALPNLSTRRAPATPNSTLHTTVPVSQACINSTIFVALATCIGAYGAVNDVLLGWLTPDVERTVRVRWKTGQSWEDVVQGLLVADVTGEDVRQCLGLNGNQEPFLAVLSQDTTRTCDHPLVLTVSNSTLHVQASALLFHDSTLSLFSNQIQALVLEISSRSTNLSSDLSFLPVSVQSRHDSANDGDAYTHIDVVPNVTDYVSRRARSDPSAIAVQFFPKLGHSSSDMSVHVETVTYAELHTNSNRFARYLLAQGLELEDRVALCLPRGLEFHICLLGVLKAGGCYVPIDPELPSERQSFIAKDSKARFILSSASIKRQLQDAVRYSSEDISIASPNGLAYLLYTSGTTGTPKGCLLTHNGLSEAILALSVFAFEAGAQDGRYLAVASIAFDVHLAETFVAFALGMTLITAPRSSLLEDLPRWLRALGITHVGIVPSLIEVTMGAVNNSIKEEPSPGGEGRMNLRFIASGGEKMSDSILERWANHPQVKLANFYGPSEVTIGCAARFMSSDTRKENIGCVFANCSAYVVDENLDVVMRGAVGELLVAGPLVGRGYHERPELTKKAFLEWEGKWTYRTGDLVRMMPDSTLEIMGRIDTQIKLRGVRIESEGISNILRNATTFRDTKLNLDVATVLARHPSLQTDQLVSFIAWDSSISVAHRRSQRPQILLATPNGLEKDLKEACVKELASYMRPAHIVPLDFLPLNLNGKTDNKLLVTLFQEADLKILARGHGRNDVTKDGASVSIPRELGKTEKEVVNIVVHHTMVPREQLNASSNLFALGFDSMKMIQLASQLRHRFNLVSTPISVGDMMTSPTIAAIASKIEERQRMSDLLASTIPQSSYVTAFESRWKDEVADMIELDRIESILPTLPVQDGVLYRSTGAPNLYIQHVILRCHPGISLHKLQSAWHAIMSKHEVLRTIFLFSSTIVQVVLHREACRLPWKEQKSELENLLVFTPWFLEKEAPQLSAAITEDISSTPPFRLSLYSICDKQVLAVSIHHSIYDGISLPLLLKDVEDEYLDKALRPSVPLAQVLEHVYSVDSEKGRTYWQRLFEGFNWSQYSPRLASGTQSRQLSVRFNKSISELEGLAAAMQATFQALLTSAYAICLRRHLYHRDDVVFGTIRSGRSLVVEEVNDARCPLISIQPVRVDFNHHDALVQSVQRDIGNAIEFEHIPLGKVQQWIRPGKTLFETLFSISIKVDDKAELWDLVESTQPQPDYFLAIEIVLDRASGEVVAHAAYTDEDISLETVSHFLEDLEQVAVSLVHGDPEDDTNAINHEEPTLQLNGQPELYAGETADEIYPHEPSDPDLEDRLRHLVAQFLQLDANHITPTSPLISLGLDSIKSMGLSRKLRLEGIYVTAVDLMTWPTIRHLAIHHQDAFAISIRQEEVELLAKAREDIANSFDVGSTKLDDSDVVEVFPTTVLQAGMLSQTINSKGQLYVHAFPLKLSNEVDLIRLEGAWKQAVQMSAILRTTFHFVPDLGCWAQVIHSEADVKWTEAKLTLICDVHAGIAKFVDSIKFPSEEAFQRAPIYLHLLRDDAPKHSNSHLVVVMHHALYDGVSISKLFDLVQSIYRREELVEITQFKALLGYFEYQQRHGTAFWIQYLKDSPVFRMPRDALSIADQSSHTCEVDILIASEQLDNVSRHCGVTPQCFGQVAWAKVLTILAHDNDVVFGHVISGRNLPFAENVIGPMLNTIPCRVRLPSHSRNFDILRSVHQNNVSALRWQHASLRSIQHDLGRSIVWDSIFLFQPPLDDLNGCDLWEFDGSRHDVAKVQYALNIELHQFRDCLTVKAACSAEVMTIQSLKALLHHFRQLFMKIVEHPEENVISDVPELLGYEDNPRHRVAHQTQYKPNIFLRAVWKPEDLIIQDLLAATMRVPKANINMDTPLVALGIDSISAIQIASKCREIGFRLGASDILRCEVVSDLLHILRSKINRQETEVSGLSPHISTEEATVILSRLQITTTDDVESISTVSAGMKWLIGIWQRSRRSRFQHAFAFRLPPYPFDTDKLRRAWVQLVSRHAILRSTFASSPSSNNIRMVTFKHLPVHLAWSYDCLRSEGSGDVTVAEYLKTIVSSPLSTKYPPTRAVLLSIGEYKYLVLHLHHFQYDAWSLPILLDDLACLYRGERPSSHNNLAEYLDQSNSSRVMEQEQYWRRHFPSPVTSSFFPRMNIDEACSTCRTIYTEPAALDNLLVLNRRAQRLMVSLNAIFLACWARIQAQYTGDSWAVFGLWHLGRSGVLDGIESLAAPCMNVLPIYVQDAQSPSLDTALRIQSELKRMSPTVEQSDLEQIDEWVGGNGMPLCNVFINIIKEPPKTEDESRDMFIPLETPYHIPEVAPPDPHTTVGQLAVSDLIQDDVMVDIVVSDSAGKILMSVECDNSIMDVEQARKLIKEWATEVQKTLENEP